jgi:hypothetical protein
VSLVPSTWVEVRQTYGRWVELARRTCAQGGQVCAVLQAHTSMSAQWLVRPLNHFLARMGQVSDQIVRRVCHGEIGRPTTNS